jgi:hypothetical protein
VAPHHWSLSLWRDMVGARPFMATPLTAEQAKQYDEQEGCFGWGVIQRLYERANSNNADSTNSLQQMKLPKPLRLCLETRETLLRSHCYDYLSDTLETSTLCMTIPLRRRSNTQCSIFFVLRSLASAKLVDALL